MFPNEKIGIIGNGSWATAIAKLLNINNVDIFWFFRKKQDIDYIKQNRRNPRYLSTIEFNTEKIFFSDDINEIVENSQTLYFIVPSAYLDIHTQNLKVSLKKKLLVSGIKGIIPSTNLLFTDHISSTFDISSENVVAIAGPSHAEEVAMGRLTFLTIVSQNLYNAEIVANQLENQYLRTFINDDIYGVEYSAVLKNIYALAAGICQALGYGDNFTAVLMSNAMQEIERFINTVDKRQRNLFSSAYLGDLLGTAYSKFSRNRTFGLMIGKGYSVRAAKLEMNMIAEGYFATESFYKINSKFNIYMPILEAVYNILYQNKPAGFEIKLLTHKIR